MVNETGSKTEEDHQQFDLTPINYDTSFLDESYHDDTTFNANTIKEEFTTMQEEFAQHSHQEPMEDEYDDNFEIDDFFRMKPKSPSVAVLNRNKAIKMESGRDGNVTFPLDNATADDAPEANDIIQEAAIIDDDFFSQIRESMDVLYDKILC